MKLNITTKKIVHIVLLLSIIFYAVLIIHDFFGYIDTYPYLSLDDGLANVSYSLAKNSRYGFLSSPLQAGTNDYRNNRFFNYGPWYFYLSAGLIYLFGYSIALLRSVHLIIILSIVIIAYVWFKGKDGKIAASLFTILILFFFDNLQWPIVRPDIMVSFFAILFIVSSGLAMKDRKPVHWFLAGMFAICAALSHLIAWSLILSCIIVFLVAQLTSRKEVGNTKDWRRRAKKDSLYLLFGVLFSILMFFGSFDFRFKEFFSFLGAYNQQINAAHPGYLKVLSTHVKALSYHIYNRPAVISIVIIIALGIIVLSLYLWRKERKKTITYLLPPVIVGSLYLLSLGTYNNFTGGYMILLQTTGFWFTGAIVYIVFISTGSHSERLNKILSVSAITILLILLFLPIIRKLKTLNYRVQNAMNWVSITDYTNKIIEPLPAGSSAWGTIMFGIENPERIQLVQFSEGTQLVGNLPETYRKALAPDYIVWGYPENRDSFLSVLKGEPVWFESLSGLFPGYRYDLVSMVAGDPYGVTRIYQRRKNSEPFTDSLPMLNLYNPATRQWDYSIMPPIERSFKVATPVKFEAGYYKDSPLLIASNTVSAQMGKDDYLLRVKIKTGEKLLQHDRMLCATSVPEVTKTLGELGPNFDCTPYVASDKETYLIHRHTGGEVYVSQFDSSPDSGILRVDVYPVQYLKDYKQDNDWKRDELYTDVLVNRIKNLRNKQAQKTFFQLPADADKIAKYKLPADINITSLNNKLIENIAAKDIFYQSHMVDIDMSSNEWTISGEAETEFAYIARTKEKYVKRGYLVAEGELFEGGLTLGLSQNEKWVNKVNVTDKGKFIIVIRIDAAAKYDAIVANNLEGPSSLKNNFKITQIGWIEQ